MNNVKQKTILLVEDEFIIALMEKKQLESKGYKVIHVGSGEEAIEKAFNNPEIDLILMDINLSTEMDGTQAAEIILKDKHIPIVFLSSHTESEVVEKTEKITSYGYVVKNSGITVLDASIKMAFKLFNANIKITESNDLLTNLAALVPSVIYQYRLYPDGKSSFPYSSPGMYDIYEVTPEEVKEDASPVYSRLHPEDYDNVVNLINESAITLKTFYCEFRVVLPNKGLRWRWSQANPVRLEDGSTLWHGIISDITEKKQMEEILKDTLEESERTNKDLEVTNEELEQTNEELSQTVEQLEESQQEIEEGIEALRKSETTFSSMFYSLPIGVSISYFKDFKIFDVNQAWRDLTGYQCKEDVIGKTTTELGLINDQVEREKIVSEFKKSGYIKNMEVSFTKKTGELRTILLNLDIIEIKDEKFIMSTNEDVTEQKEKEEAIIRYKTLLQAGIESPKDLIIMAIDKDYKYLFFNKIHKKAMQIAYGKNVEIGMNIFDCISSEEDRKNAKINYDIAFSGKPYSTIQEYGDIDKAYFESFYNPIINDKNEIVGVTAYARDITERKLKENQYLILNKKLYNLIESINNLSKAQNLEEIMKVVRSSARKLTNSDGSTFILKDGDYCSYMDEDTIEPLWKGQKFPMKSCITGWVMMNRQSAVIEDIYNDERIPVLNYKNTYVKSLAIVPIISNDCFGAIGNYWANKHLPTEEEMILLQTLADATAISMEKIKLSNEQKRNNEEIKNLLIEKDIILKEVHHRIKNNINTIDSLLTLQSDYYNNTNLNNILNEIRSNLQSFRVLYDKLYKSNDYQEILINEYLESLIDEIKKIFPLKKLIINTDIERFMMKEKILSTVGIIIIEMITNSIKYAFNGINEPIIKVKSFKNDNKITLIYEDNGIGLPGNITFENSTGFGLRLIYMLVQQIKGNIKIERDKGTKYIIEFIVN